MNFRFTNLLGAPYRGGTILLSKGDSLLAPVGNRVNEVNIGEKFERSSRRRRGQRLRRRRRMPQRAGGASDRFESSWSPMMGPKMSFTIARIRIRSERSSTATQKSGNDGGICRETEKKNDG
jgi:hypothetical protein